MTPAEHLSRAGDHLSRAYADIDAAVGGLRNPEHGAALLLRGEVAGLILRLARIQLFAERGGSSPGPPAA